MKNFRSFAASYLLFIVFVACCSSCSSPAINTGASRKETDAALQRKINKDIVASFYQALNDSNWQKLKSLVSDDYRHYYATDTGFKSIPWASVERAFKGVRSAFADWRLTPVNMVAEDDYVSVMLVGAGTHTGSFAGIPATNKVAKAPAMTFHQLKNGKIIADWELLDTSAFLEQLKR